VATDVQGKEFVVGQQVAKAAKLYRADGLFVEVAEVTKINGDKVYLDNSLQPLKFPGRVAIIAIS